MGHYLHQERCLTYSEVVSRIKDCLKEVGFITWFETIDFERRGKVYQIKGCISVPISKNSLQKPNEAKAFLVCDIIIKEKSDEETNTARPDQVDLRVAIDCLQQKQLHEIAEETVGALSQMLSKTIKSKEGSQFYIGLSVSRDYTSKFGLA